MQQVQVMRDEFRNQKPILDSFNNSGDHILTQTSPDSPDGRKIEDKLASINQRVRFFSLLKIINLNDLV